MARLILSIALAFLLGACTTTRPSPPPAQPTPAPSGNTGTFTPADKYLFADVPTSHGYPNSWTIIQNIGYETAYDDTFKNPAWVAYHLPGNVEGTPLDRPSIGYPTDNRTVSKVTAADYPPGYDHGHCAPNFAISYYFGEAAQTETFFMSNMMPQRPGLNRGPWKVEETAEYVKWTKPGHDVWVICGPVYTTADNQPINPTQRFGPKSVCIPVACFKIVMTTDVGGHLETLAFIMPEEDAAGHKPAEFLTSIREIEQRTGLNFFSSLPQQQQDVLETIVSTSLWP